MRARPRLDGNQVAIVERLREHYGCSVQSLASVGRGCPDLLVGHGGKNWLFEVKDLRTRRGREGLTPDERAWAAEWRGQVATIFTAEDAAKVMGL